jgi:exopolysaccharide production protein ExoQ
MSKLDTALTTFVLLIYISAFTPSQFQQGFDVAGDPAGKVGSFLTALSAPLVLLLVYRNWDRFRDRLRHTTWPIFMVSLVLVSTLWSINSGITLRRSVILAVTSVYAVHLGTLAPEFRDRLFGRAVFFTIVASYLIVLFLPAYGVSGGTHFGEWRGVFDQKNILGKQMVFSFFLAIYSRAFQSRVTARLVAVLALVLLLMSRSGTAIAAFGIILVIAGMLSIRSYFARRETVAIFWLLVVPPFLALTAAGIGFRSELFQMFGKDPTLTGRTLIWSVVWEGITKKPWLGWGFEVFFNQPELRTSFGIAGAANHAHDGFLDVILATGFLGLAVFLIGYFIACRNAWRTYSVSSDKSAQWPLLFLAMLVFLNLPESVLLRTGTFLWIPYVAFALWGVRGTYSDPTLDIVGEQQALPTHSFSA